MGLRTLRLQRQPLYICFLVVVLLFLLYTPRADSFHGIHHTYGKRSASANRALEASIGQSVPAVSAVGLTPEAVAYPNSQGEWQPTGGGVPEAAKSVQKPSTPALAPSSPLAFPLPNQSPGTSSVNKPQPVNQEVAFPTPAAPSNTPSVPALPPTPWQPVATAVNAAPGPHALEGAEQLYPTWAGSQPPPQGSPTAPGTPQPPPTSAGGFPSAQHLPASAVSPGVAPYASVPGPCVPVQYTQKLQTPVPAAIVGQAGETSASQGQSNPALAPISATTTPIVSPAEVVEQNKPDHGNRAWIVLLVISSVSVLALVALLLCLFTVRGRELNAERRITSTSSTASPSERSRVPRLFDQSTFGQDSELRSKSMRSASLAFNRSPRHYGSSPALSTGERISRSPSFAPNA